jgi:PleD family two-component response regulator
MLGYLFAAVSLIITAVLAAALRARTVEAAKAASHVADLQSRLTAATDEAERLRSALAARERELTAALRDAAGSAPAEVVDVLPRLTVVDTSPPATGPTARSRVSRAVPPAIVLVAVGGDATRAQTVSHLNKGGYSVVEAATAADARRLAASEKPAVVLLDAALPYPGGQEALAGFKADAALRELPVVLVCPAKDRERAMEMGAAGTVTEGDAPSVLLGTIKATLTEQKRRAERSRLATKIKAA